MMRATWLRGGRLGPGVRRRRGAIERAATLRDPPPAAAGARAATADTAAGGSPHTMVGGALLALAAALAASRPAAARELDPAACAARFDVQRDKIIRTEESREMGARYLSELDVGARHECRRLCCETDACDVFVYEEKSPGSCYLFNCGPPEDFRCKFTAHSNFSSGVLALSRRLAELQDQERLPPPRRLAPTTTTTTPPPPPSPPKLAPAGSTQPPPTPAAHPAPRTTSQPASRCSRYQWECHSGGECIAVYNACDGVAQCADGSDEAPELGCPAAPARASPAPAPAPLNVYEPEAGAGAGERWPHRLLQAQPRRYPAPVSEGVASHIFSHKGGLVQEEPAFEPPAPPQPWPRHPWPPRQGAESGGWAGWARDWVGRAAEVGGPPEAGGAAEAAGPAEAGGRRAWPAPPAPAPPDPEMPYVPGKTMPELPEVYPQPVSLHDAPKKGPRPAAAPAPAARRGGGGRDELDGLSEHPPAAVLLLVLGVAMTGAMGVLVGCRARAARRRLRRAGKPFAHDADYLVNGMYL
ncbi:uncharacterized protein LOC126368261 [Pectinophora gossypiella]|uniref:uncharacterized protein LOC126368261 n=1 Tax=Pectinophora gossypiella TaxID=13191 RepID=UPI00214E6B99|nr:uncharacterized protein LOC126368261 [Pectinophora gossypiella]